MELHPTPDTSRWAGLRRRLITAVVVGAGFLFVLIKGGVLFETLILLAALQMIREWDNLTREEGEYWLTIGFSYVALPCISLLWLRNLEFAHMPDAGLRIVFYLILTVWATDIGAYFAGKRFGRHKLAPTISPGKTWEGLIGGMLAAAIVGGFAASFTPLPRGVVLCAVGGIILAAVAQSGDLFESWLKRRAGVKDSGNIFPGHGGLLDRIDGLVFTAPLLAVMVALS